MVVESRVYRSDPIISASTQQQHVTCSENGCFFKRKSIRSVAIRHLWRQRPSNHNQTKVRISTRMYVHVHIYVCVDNPTSVSRERAFEIRRCASCQFRTIPRATCVCVCTCMYVHVHTYVCVGNPAMLGAF